MKPITTSDTKCRKCYWFREPEWNEKSQADGFCTHKDRPCGKNVYYTTECDDWEHKETRITHFEVHCGRPEDKRTPAEKEYILRLIGKETR